MAKLPICPVNYWVLIELYKPEEKKGGFIDKTDKTIHSQVLQTHIGKVISSGDNAFTQADKFYEKTNEIKEKDWIIFKGNERDLVRVDGIDYAFITDDRIIGKTKKPEDTQTVFDMYSEHGA